MTIYEISTSHVNKSFALIERDAMVEIFEFLLKEMYSSRNFSFTFSIGDIRKSESTDGFVAEIFSDKPIDAFFSCGKMLNVLYLK